MSGGGVLVRDEINGACNNEGRIRKGRFTFRK